MKNHKHLLMDFYLNLLAIPVNDPFRINNQALYAVVVGTLALELGCSNETVRRIFERMVREDGK